MDERLAVYPVAAEAYGRRGQLLRAATLTHAVELDDGGCAVRVLCSKVDLGSILEDGCLGSDAPTCPACARKFKKLTGREV